jgi:hypothetical protein
MTLRKCPDCSSEISKKAISCPACGRAFYFEKITYYIPHLFLAGFLLYQGYAIYQRAIAILPMTCENILKDVYLASEENRQQNEGVRVVKISEYKEIERDNNGIVCSGTARWSDLTSSQITYRKYTDSENMTWIEIN